jgi:hypothetical protein
MCFASAREIGAVAAMYIYSFKKLRPRKMAKGVEI